MHCSWVPLTDIQAAAKLPPMPPAARSKLRKVLFDAETYGKAVSLMLPGSGKSPDPSLKSESHDSQCPSSVICWATHLKQLLKF